MRKLREERERARKERERVGEKKNAQTCSLAQGRVPDSRPIVIGWEVWPHLKRGLLQFIDTEFFRTCLLVLAWLKTNHTFQISSRHQSVCWHRSLNSWSSSHCKRILGGIITSFFPFVRHKKTVVRQNHIKKQILESEDQRLEDLSCNASHSRTTQAFKWDQ